MKILSLALLFFLAGSPLSAAVQQLPSWKQSTTKAEIMTFVERVCSEDSPDYVPPAERIAVFDNDGTLWAEQPMYFQLAYVVDRIQQLAAENPEWQHQEPYASIIKGDVQHALADGHQKIIDLVLASHAGVTTEEFNASVAEWIAEARHPTTGRRYDEMVYQPMLELLDYLREHEFKTFIVSGGGIDFMRVFVEATYGIPPEQTIGSSIKASYEVRDGKPVIVKLPALNFIDDKEGKPVGIHQHIGRRPIFAAGNSDGDFEMLEWTTSGEGARMGILIHHTDAEREWAYDRDSPIGKLIRGLDEADERGWIFVDMKEDWLTVFPDP
ncbi:MAG: HAD family hydrolase [Coraliomargarita sp.]